MDSKFKVYVVGKIEETKFNEWLNLLENKIFRNDFEVITSLDNYINFNIDNVEKVNLARKYFIVAKSNFILINFDGVKNFLDLIELKIAQSLDKIIIGYYSGVNMNKLERVKGEVSVLCENNLEIRSVFDNIVYDNFKTLDIVDNELVSFYLENHYHLDNSINSKI